MCFSSFSSHSERLIPSFINPSFHHSSIGLPQILIWGKRRNWDNYTSYEVTQSLISNSDEASGSIPTIYPLPWQYLSVPVRACMTSIWCVITTTTPCRSGTRSIKPLWCFSRGISITLVARCLRALRKIHHSIIPSIHHSARFASSCLSFSSLFFWSSVTTCICWRCRTRIRWLRWWVPSVAAERLSALHTDCCSWKRKTPCPRFSAWQASALVLSASHWDEGRWTREMDNGQWAMDL